MQATVSRSSKTNTQQPHDITESPREHNYRTKFSCMFTVFNIVTLCCLHLRAYHDYKQQTRLFPIVVSQWHNALCFCIHQPCFFDSPTLLKQTHGNDDVYVLKYDSSCRSFVAILKFFFDNFAFDVREKANRFTDFSNEN